jgi:hypothetical protein
VDLVVDQGSRQLHALAELTCHQRPVKENNKSFLNFDLTLQTRQIYTSNLEEESRIKDRQSHESSHTNL